MIDERKSKLREFMGIYYNTTDKNLLKIYNDLEKTIDKAYIKAYKEYEKYEKQRRKKIKKFPITFYKGG